jgi:hypothetical protein
MEGPPVPGARYRELMMSGCRMVHLRTVSSTFHARVIAARLGADGIVTQLRGNVGGPYPLGDVSVWVTEDDVSAAAELLLADEIEAAFTPHPDDEEPLRWRRPVFFGLNRRQILASVGIVVVLWVAVLSRLVT